MVDSYFYDKQIRRFLTQIVSVFSNFHVFWGNDDDGNPTYRRVPARYALTDSMVASLLKDNSENKMLNVPAISIYITNLTYDRDRVQDPTHIEKINIRQKKMNTLTGEYTPDQGNSFTLERHMPVPYTLEFNVDIWTSSLEQKLELLEQLLVLFNPMFEIQSTDNYLDWASLSYIEVQSSIWSSRSVPVSDQTQLDIATLSFTCPIWISSAAKLKKLGVIQNIISTIYDSSGNFDDGIIDSLNQLGERLYITPTGYNLLLLNGEAKLVPAQGPIDPGNRIDPPKSITDPAYWEPIASKFGTIKNGITQLRLRKNNPDTTREVIGTVSYKPGDPSTLLFNVDVDTIPSNSLQPVNAIIDPTRSGPGINGLPAATPGTRYLLINDIGNVANQDGPAAWKNADGSDFYARENDIIEYNGTSWTVSWKAANSTKIEYVTNIKTGLQFKWNKQEWVKSYEGIYPEGTWSLVF